MLHATHGLASTVRTAVRCIYVVAGVIWLGALAFAGYRFYQMRTLTSLEAEVLRAEVDSYTATSRDTDSDGFTMQSPTQVYVPVVWVRYRFNNKVYSVGARHDTGGLKWVQDRIAQGWKPGARIRIHIDPDEPGKPVPDLGLNLHTFQMSIVLVFTGWVFVLFGYAFSRMAAFASRAFEHTVQRYASAAAAAGPRRSRDLPAPVPVADDDEPLPVPIGTAKAVAGVVCCVTSPLFDPLGYALTVVGLILLWGGTSFSVRARLVATAVVLPPRIAPLLLSALAGPGDFSFVLNPSAPATSSSAWGWYGLLWAVYAALMLMFSEKGNALLAGAGLQEASPPGTRYEHAPILLIIPALLVLAWATNAVLGLQNEFEWVQAAKAGAWDLKHSVRGTVATFTAETVASIDGREEGHKDKPTYHIRFALKRGDARVMSTRSPSAFGEMKKLAATMDLPPGRLQLKSASGEAWTNGRFTVKARTGTYEAANGNLVELRLDQSGRLTGTESFLGSGGERLTRSLRAVKVTEDGGIEYRTGIFTSAAGHFEDEGLVIGGTMFRRPVK
jgi:hypothetical protein